MFVFIENYSNYIVEFYLGPELEPGPVALHASVHTTTSVLDGVVVSALARKARGTGSIPGPG